MQKFRISSLGYNLLCATSVFLVSLMIIPLPLQGDGACQSKEAIRSKQLAAVADDGTNRLIALRFTICQKAYNGISIRQLSEDQLSSVEEAYIRRMKKINNRNYDSIMKNVYQKHPDINLTEDQVREGIKAVYRGMFEGVEEPLEEIRLTRALYLDDYVLFLYEVPTNPLYYEFFKKVEGTWKTPAFGWYTTWASFWKESLKININNQEEAQKVLNEQYKKHVRLNSKNDFTMNLSYNGTRFHNLKLLGKRVSKHDVHPALKTYYDANRAAQMGKFKNYVSFYYGTARENRRRNFLDQGHSKKEFLEQRRESLRKSVNGKYVFYMLRASPLYVIFYRRKNNGEFTNKIEYDFVIQRRNNDYKISTKNQVGSIISFFSSEYFKDRMLPGMMSHLSVQDK